MKVQIIVEQASDGKFWCYTEQGIGDVGLSAMGDSVAAAKADLMECYEEARLDAEENDVAVLVVWHGKAWYCLGGTVDVGRT